MVACFLETHYILGKSEGHVIAAELWVSSGVGGREFEPAGPGVWRCRGWQPRHGHQVALWVMRRSCPCL